MQAADAGLAWEKGRGHVAIEDRFISPLPPRREKSSDRDNPLHLKKKHRGAPSLVRLKVVYFSNPDRKCQRDRYLTTEAK